MCICVYVVVCVSICVYVFVCNVCVYVCIIGFMFVLCGKDNDRERGWVSEELQL